MVGVAVEIATAGDRDLVVVFGYVSAHVLGLWSGFALATVVCKQGKDMSMETGLVRKDVLQMALALISGDRQEQYGDFREQMIRVTGIFRLMTGVEMTPEQGGKFLMVLKLVRMETARDFDSEVDLCGYTALCAEHFKAPKLDGTGDGE